MLLQTALAVVVDLFVFVESSFAGIPSWPDTLVVMPTQPESDGYAIASLNELLRSEMDRGPARMRRMFTKALHRLDFDLLMSPAQFMIFKGFYASTLRQGTRQFSMEIWDGSKYRTARLRFVQPYAVRDYAVDMSRVTFSVIAYNLED
jgi:hypothetical protein